MQNGIATLEKSFVVYYEVNLPYDPEILLLSICKRNENTDSYKDLYISAQGALFTAVQLETTQMPRLLVNGVSI